MNPNIYILQNFESENGIRLIQRHKKVEKPIILVRDEVFLAERILAWEESIRTLMLELEQKQIDVKEFKRSVHDRTKLAIHRLHAELDINFYKTTINNFRYIMSLNLIKDQEGKERDVFNSFSRWFDHIKSDDYPYEGRFQGLHEESERERIPTEYVMMKHFFFEYDEIAKKKLVDDYVDTLYGTDDFVNKRKFLKSLFTFRLKPILYDLEIKQPRRVNLELPFYVRFDNWDVIL